MDDRTDDLAQAVNSLLRSRRETHALLGRLDAALDALGVDAETRNTADPDASPADFESFVAKTFERGGGSVSRRTNVSPGSDVDLVADGVRIQIKAPRSVRAAVQDILDAQDVWYSTADLTAMIRKVMGDDRTADKIKSNVRSSLWSLRKQGLIVAKDHTYKATKWLTDTDAASGDSETASGSIPADKEGGGTNGIDADRVRDHHSLGTAGDRDHGIGAPVVGVPS